MVPGLIERFYEAALVPEAWPAALESLSRLADARGGQIFVARPTTGPILRWAASPAFEQDMAAYVAGRWALQDRRRERITAGLRDGFVTEQDIFTESELETDAAYRGFYRPRGLGWGALTSVTLPTGDWFVVSVERDYARGPVEPAIVAQLDALRPHIARSAFLSARLGLERARAIGETLALIGLPCLVFDRQGKVLAANHLMEALSGHVRWRARDRISFVDRRADHHLAAAVGSIDTETALSVRSFAVRDAGAAASMVAHIIPIHGDARDLFARCVGVLALTPVAAPHALPVELVRSLFDLTPAEARVARHLAAGDTLDEIAAYGRVKRNTVRTQLRGVLEKTGCRRQAEVVALLSGIAVHA